ncbi:MAG: UDP-N-acetylglucosamine 1-carboxyvinyltransferase [Lentisphaeria bacterium]|nr:UDP-N-acetylglucosamine 1-carboxyvinyltransferase [Lentisphaeria bacterium]
MRSLIINGGNPVSGTVTVGGNKNAVLPMIAATLLTSEPVIMHNVPKISDVDIMLKILKHLGASVVRKGNDVTVCCEKIRTGTIPRDLCSALRTSILFAGPLAARTGGAKIYPPGGDVIGRRRLDSHFYGLRKLGISVGNESTPFVFEQKAKSLHGADLFLDEASVTATEHIMMTAAAAKGKTFIRNAASEPHIRQLGEMLISMGAKIEGLDSNTIEIEGNPALHGTEVTVESDHIEVASFLALAAATRCGLTIKGDFKTRDYWMTRRMFERLGIKFKLSPGLIEVPPRQRMKIQPDFGNAIPQIADGPWPQFPSDMMSCMIVCATQAKGTVLFFEKMFESRIYFVDRLISMGANAVVCDPHRVVITGPVKLRGVEMSSPDIRAGMAMVIAAICAKGRSVIHNADTIFRGYEDICEKLVSLGVDITCVTTDPK